MFSGLDPSKLRIGHVELYWSPYAGAVPGVLLLGINRVWLRSIVFRLAPEHTLAIGHSVNILRLFYHGATKSVKRGEAVLEFRVGVRETLRAVGARFIAPCWLANPFAVLNCGAYPIRTRA